MRPKALSRTVAALLLGSVAAFAENGPQPVQNPLPGAIPQGDIVVSAMPFVRAPKTTDPATPVGTNDAYARIQYLMPIPDGSGRLVFNDLRGFLYVTDASGRDPVVYLDLNAQDVGFYNAAYPNETGLLGFAFHPQFSDEGKPGHGKFYTAFTAVPAGFGSSLTDDAIRQLTIGTDALRPGHPAPIEELRLLLNGEERAPVDVVGFGNTYHGGVRADLRLGLDAVGELYLLTKGDGWIRKLVAIPGSGSNGIGGP